MRGRDGTILHYGLGAEARVSDRETRDSFMLTEAGWFVINSGSPVPATKQDFLSVLADIEVRYWRGRDGLWSLKCLTIVGDVHEVLSEPRHAELPPVEGDDGHSSGPDDWGSPGC